ncbi:hypothetical protein BHE74_00001529 [Ensete ventricosum]|nr:hypothetical protein GW17_00001618 [Ensete ventricosum]RWW89522.1 hypothetical protein BHE74_00001529 [Ensete ventricosum]
MHNLHDLTEAVFDVGGEGEGDIGGEVGDADALRNHLDRLLRYYTHCLLSYLPLLLVSFDPSEVFDLEKGLGLRSKSDPRETRRWRIRGRRGREEIGWRRSRGTGEMSDLDRQIEQLKRCEPLKESEVKALCLKAMEILVEESNVQRVDAPVTVRSPLMDPFFSAFPYFPSAISLPRNVCSVLVRLPPICNEVRYPDRITLIRGNHESRQITQVQDLKDQKLF